MTFSRSILLLAAAAMLWAGSAAAQMVGPPRPGPRCLPGSYDGGQMEMAAKLELEADNRFRYMLSYGALDEVAEGKWQSRGADSVLLTSDPTTPPKFSLLSASGAAPDRLDFTLDMPRGISRQYFSAIVRFADGRSSVRQFQDDGLIFEFRPEEKPVSFSLLLSVLDVESGTFPIPAGGGAFHLRFEPNDLGKVAFAETPLRIDQEDLLLERHDRLIRFRRSAGGC